jgi:poly(3-hydroxybutyrate) depolymerase
VAGLSAGAAMAVVLGETYPEVFAGVGAHSGLPYGSAHDIPSAMAAMKGGRSGMPGLRSVTGAAAAPGRKAAQAVPVIVFHGDRDHTVQQANGEHIVQQARDAHRQLSQGDTGLRAESLTGVAPGGRRFSRTVHADDRGHVRIEHWTLHGAGTRLVGWARERLLHRQCRPGCVRGNGAVLHGAATRRLGVKAGRRGLSGDVHDG